MSGGGVARRLVGTWSLVDYAASDEAGTVRRPMGPDPIGLLIYTTDGSVCVQIARRARDPFPTGDAGSALAPVRAAAAAGFLAYGGSYDVEEDVPAVTHHVRISLVPNWIGSLRRRVVRMDEDRLELSGPAVHIDGIRQAPRLTWVRGHPGSIGAEHPAGAVRPRRREMP
jgi:hypothetical protein